MRRGRKARLERPPEQSAVEPGFTGGQYKPLTETEIEDAKLAPLPANDAYVVFFCEFGHAASFGECLDDVDVPANDVRPWGRHLSNNVDFVPADSGHDNTDHRLGDVAPQFAGNLVANLRWGSSRSLYIANQGERDATIGSNQHLALQFFLFPNRNVEDVFRPNQVFGRWRLRPRRLRYARQHG